MTEIEFDLYSSLDIDDMLIWCRRNLPPQTWSVLFDTDHITFRFKNHQHALYFAATWQPPQKKKIA